MKEMELYIHIPFCVKKCQYCDFLSFPAGEDVQNAYVEALLREIAYYGPRCFEYTVTTIYIGGGKVISASNPTSGIRINKYNYRTPVRYVRILNE